MTDDDLDRRLRQALGVAPSPDLAARVRARVADAPVAGRLWTWWPAVAGGLGVAALAAMPIVMGPERPHDEDAHGAVVPDRAAASESALHPVPETRASSASRAAIASSPQTPSHRLSRPEVESITPEPRLAPGDAEAFRVLLAFSRAALGVGATVDPQALESLAPPPLEVPPLEIAPLALADTVFEGDSR